MKTKLLLATSLVAITGLLGGCLGSGNGTNAAATQKNVIFFLGDGMGITTLTAARIYSVGETGNLTMDTLPETAFVKTYSNDAQVTDSAPSMAAYMTGVKTNNEVISMTPDTVATPPSADANGNLGINNCQTSNGKSVPTLLELAKAKGWKVGSITTTELTHATPAATFSHICNRNAQYAIAAQLTPGGSGFNSALNDGVDVLMGGGLNHFTPYVAATNAKGRADGRDLTAELAAQGYVVAKTKADMLAAANDKKLIGLYSKTSHLEYDLDRQAQVTAGTGNGVTQPSLAEMTTKAMDVLSYDPNGNRKSYFLMVEGGRIDHALHSTNAKRALQDTVAFDNAIKAAIDKARLSDPNLANTLIVVTADHDHTLVLNGYAARTGKTTATNPGVLGLVKNYVTGLFDKDADSQPYSIIGFGNGESRNATRVGLNLTEATTGADNYHQEATIEVGAGSETHGGTDVFLGAIGMGADTFHGSIDNTKVFTLVKTAAGL
jgi:alkaline phosphatase